LAYEFSVLEEEAMRALLIIAVHSGPRRIPVQALWPQRRLPHMIFQLHSIASAFHSD
jgi:hypothetical protein